MKNRTIWIVMLGILSTAVFAMPARAIVIEDALSHHPLVAFVSAWASSNEKTEAPLPTSINEMMNPLSSTVSNLPTPDVSPVSSDDMTVEILPITLPKLPSYMVFVVYLAGAMLFYTMLVLVAQPGPAESL